MSAETLNPETLHPEALKPKTLNPEPEKARALGQVLEPSIRGFLREPWFQGLRVHQAGVQGFRVCLGFRGLGFV